MKRVIAILLICVLSFGMVSCASKSTESTDSSDSNETSVTENETELTEESEITEVSVFVGEWRCLKENSCNDMEIILTISQENGQLNVERDMESDSSSGSIITFSVEVPTQSSFYSADISGTYTLTDGVLLEEFEDGKKNYYSATGELETNICGFPFCYEECGDSKYCNDHDTTDKRYNSLTDSNKKSICYYIEGRYDYYDSIENGDSGDKYSDQIMQETANKYGITSEQAFIVWMNYYSY